MHKQLVDRDIYMHIDAHDYIDIPSMKKCLELPRCDTLYQNWIPFLAPFSSTAAPDHGTSYKAYKMNSNNMSAEIFLYNIKCHSYPVGWIST